MDFGEIAKSVRDQFVMVADAPVPFIASLLFAGWLIWLAVKHTFATRLENARSTIDLQDRQLQDYKDKLDGASPEQAKARLDALEQRIEDGFRALAPRRVSDEQRQAMVAILDAEHGNHVTIAQDAAIADARPLAQGIAAVFHAARWTTSSAMVMGLGNPPPSGVGLMVQDQNNLTPPQRAIYNALQAAGIAFDIQNGGVGINEPGGRQSVAEIIVTSPLA
ncbi:MAG TPA: hypothetical protein PKC48_03330 [Sphingorhabdus sp.]|jgi:hypothetical protein|uniref:hypothetical protein n=1 Tax=Sphingorhabdus sp. TaxID=1902408 RepID=UPI002D1D44E2|nr:hypothetical protein [Sphingorhabdus sp.]HMT40535.1 hypothetical protein [Sphingorhabdus sp.]HMU21290.1 hypothetical protein [Sphingorhabdus sp.]